MRCPACWPPMTSFSRAERNQRFGWSIFAAAALLTLLTVLNFFVLDRFEPAGPAVDVLPPGGVALSNADRTAVLQQDFAVPLGASKGFIRISADVEGEGIVRGDRPWQRGRIVFLRRDAEGGLIWDIPHVVGRFWGDTERRWIGSLYRGDDRAESLMIRVELLKATGELKVHRLLAEPMQEAPGFRPVANALLIGWIALAVLATVWAWRRVRLGHWMTGLAWVAAALALALSVLPGKAISPARIIAVEAIDLVSAEDAEPKEKAAAVSANSFSIAKSGHVVMFFLLGIVIMLARGGSGLLPVLAVSAGFAGLCEMMQLYSPNREPAAFDLQLNMISAAVGGLLTAMMLWLTPMGRLLRWR